MLNCSMTRKLAQSVMLHSLSNALARSSSKASSKLLRELWHNVDFRVAQDSVDKLDCTQAAFRSGSAPGSEHFIEHQLGGYYSRVFER